MNRREFLCGAVGVAAAGAGATIQGAQSTRTQAVTGEPTPSRLPRWRGFNLLEKFDANHDRAFNEADFALIAEWGFDFVRLPMSYLCWTGPTDWLNFREEPLRQIDQAIEFGKQYGIQVNLNLHRAPGYCVNPPKEPRDLWIDENALEACSMHWAHFARRYQGIPNSRLSFDLLNEPSDIPEDRYVHVVTALVKAIRAEDPNRLIIVDGLKWGNEPVVALAELGIAQSTRGYAPSRVSHYQASWVQGSDQWPAPTWPLDIIHTDHSGKEHREHWDKQELRARQIEPWQKLQARGVGVHVGEWGAFNRTPHQVVLAWMKDYLDLWKEVGWGWALWNLRGGFGVLDSGRTDVEYETFRGHHLDRRMLELLRG